MIKLAGFSLTVPLNETRVRQKLETFIDEAPFYSPDLAKGYTGELGNDGFRMRMAYNVQYWFRKWKPQTVRIRDARTQYDTYVAHGTWSGIPGNSTTIDVKLTLHRSAWPLPLLFLAFPFIFVWFIRDQVQGSETMLAPGILISAGMLVLLMLYHWYMAKRTARRIRADLESLFAGTWQPLVVGGGIRDNAEL